MPAYADPPVGNEARVILRVSHGLAAGLVIATLASEHFPVVLTLALAIAPYALSYTVASAVLSRSRAGAAVQSTLTLLFTLLAIEAYRGQLRDLPRTPGCAIAIGAALTAVLVIASGHGVTARRMVDSARGRAAPGRGRLLLVHALCGAVAAGSLGLRHELWSAASLQRGFPALGCALVTAALPFAASAIFSLTAVATSRRRGTLQVAILILGAAASVGYYGGLFGWPLQLWRDWLALFVLSLAFILTADWAQDEDPRFR